MSDTIEITTEQTLKEIAEEFDIDEGSLLEYVAEGIEDAHKESGVDALAKALGQGELS